MITLVLGRMPRPLFEATAATLRYRTRFSAYAMMLTPAYPKGLFGDDDLAMAPGRSRSRSATRPLIMSGAAKWLVVLFLVLGVAGDITASVTTTTTSDDTTELPGRP